MQGWIRVLDALGAAHARGKVGAEVDIDVMGIDDARVCISDDVGVLDLY